MDRWLRWLVGGTLGVGVALLLLERQPQLRKLSERFDRWGILEPARQVGPVLFEIGLLLLERVSPVYGRAARSVVDLARRGL
jgi:hypothetical protein